MMKRAACPSRLLWGLFLPLFLFCTTAIGQYVELFGFGGYYFGGKKNYGDLSLNIDNAPEFGLMAGIAIAPDLQLEFAYSRADAEVLLTDFSQDKSDRFGLAVNYFQLGLTGELDLEKAMLPYGTFSLGLSNWAPEAVEYDNVSLLAFGFGGGLKFFFGERLGARLGGRLLLPMFISGGGLWCGIGSSGPGCGANVQATGGMIEGDLHAGLIVRIGDRR